MFNFDFSYLTLPKKFYSITKPHFYSSPKILLFNNQLSSNLNVKFKNNKHFIQSLFSDNNKCFAQAYAGHQFGHFTNLGDGRAIIVGEHITKSNTRFDIQLKGGGITKYSRHGDGKATLSSMIREYLFSEAMHYLNISTSRSLALFNTGDSVYRESRQQGSVLVRVMKSHIRIGTFEYASYFGSTEDLKKITLYSLNRIYPDISKQKNPALALLNKVMNKQIELVVDWMRVGFIHGVMNTDNTSISSESFDYGPCAFINAYNPEKVFSSIDVHSRYSFGNQPKIIKWNILRLAESLIPIIHKDKDKSIELAQAVVDNFDDNWKTKYYEMMLKKIGFNKNEKTLYRLVDELLMLMKKFKMDYTNTFYFLNDDTSIKNKICYSKDFLEWKKKWENTIKKRGNIAEAKKLMKENNPFIIPRNHIIENVIEKAVDGDLKQLKEFLKIYSKPYNFKDGLEKYMTPSSIKFEESYQTFCGT